MYFIDRFKTDTLFSLDFDRLDLGPSFKAMDLPLTTLRFTSSVPVPTINSEPFFVNIDGDSGNNTLDGTADADTINGGAGDDIINGFSGDDVLDGGGAELAGSSDDTGTDIINAGDGNDTIIYSRAGSSRSDIDVNDGGVGSDTFVITSITDNRIVDLVAGIWALGDITETGPTRGTLLNIENITVSGDIDVRGDANANVIIGTDVNGSNIIEAGGGNDIINAGGGMDIINGGAGNDVIIDGDNSPADDGNVDIIDGGTGIDTYDIGTPNELATDAVTVNLMTGFVVIDGINRDSLTSIENVIVNGDANIIGGGDNNVLTALGNGDNSIAGGAGNDRINGGDGADTLDGGVGIDILDYSTSSAAVTVNLDANTASRGEAAGDVISNFESLEGSAFDDVLTSSLFFGTINGNDGNDIINLSGGLEGSSLNGGNGDDIITSAVSMNGSVLLGGDGNDELYLYADSGVIGASDVGEGGAGDDLIGFRANIYDQDADGGSGIDTLTLAALSAGFIIDMVAGGVDDGDGLNAATFSNFENIIGSSGADIITGDANDNVLSGLNGFDTINGGDGNDTLIGGFSNDVVNGGAGDDIFIIADEVLNGIITTHSNDTIDGGIGIDTLDFSGYSFTDHSDQINVDLGAGSYVSFGGTQTITGIENVVGSVEDDVITGDAFANVLSGGDGIDRLNGGDGDDILNGDAGNDLFFGGAGADTFNGGAGLDRVFYTDATAGITANFFNPSLNTGEAAGDTYNGIESINGSNFNDVITSGNDNNDLVGLGGDDVLIGAGGRDRLFGGEGNDRLLGGSGNDDLQGNAGVDTYVIQSGAGADRIFTYEVGVDIIEYNGGPSDFSQLTIEQVGGNTRITSIVGVLTLIGITATDITADAFTFINPLPDATGVDVTTTLTDGNDVFVGDENDDIVDGLAGNDNIRGGIGDDELIGGEGNDLLNGGLGADILNGGEGTDTVIYSLASTGVTINAINSALNTGEAAGDTYISIERFTGSNGNDSITSGNEDNRLTGLGGDDLLIGAGGNDVLFGGNDDDRLLGGTGDDRLSGQQGVDTFVFQENGGNDIVTDFEDGVDILEFRDLVTDFSDLTITQEGADTLITSANGTVTLEGFDSTQLDVSDFSFL